MKSIPLESERGFRSLTSGGGKVSWDFVGPESRVKTLPPDPKLGLSVPLHPEVIQNWEFWDLQASLLKTNATKSCNDDTVKCCLLSFCFRTLSPCRSLL